MIRMHVRFIMIAVIQIDNKNRFQNDEVSHALNVKIKRLPS